MGSGSRSKGGTLAKASAFGRKIFSPCLVHEGLVMLAAG